jgi:hypothetical protein
MGKGVEVRECEIYSIGINVISIKFFYNSIYMTSLDKIVKEEIDRFYVNKAAQRENIPERLDEQGLMQKYNISRSQVDQLQARQAKELQDVDNKVKHFADYIYRKVGVHNQTLSAVVKIAKSELQVPEVAKRFALSERDFHLFVQYYTHLMAGAGEPPAEHDSTSQINASLGGVIYPGITPSAPISGKDNKETIDKIGKMAGAGRMLHMIACQQCAVYEDLECATGSWNELRDQISCAMHPLLVAMFAPKVKVLEDRFLCSNLGQLIVDRVNGAPIRSRADFEMYVDLCNDKNESICSKDDVFTDLLKRVNVQQMLRGAVCNMRNGLFFRCNSNGFLMSIDQCRQSPYDTPHLVYSRDEAVILSRLLNVLSFRPTHVAITPIHNMHNTPVPRALVHQIPMMICHVPSYRSLEMIQSRAGAAAGAATNPEIHLLPRGEGGPDDQPLHLHLINGVAQPMRQAILYSRDVIFFYVNRRFHSIIPQMTTYDFSRMPMTLTGLRKINYVKVTVPRRLNGAENGPRTQPFANVSAAKQYALRSVVCVRPNPNSPEYEAGCFTILCDTNGTAKHIYDPIGLKHRSAVEFKCYSPPAPPPAALAGVAAAAPDPSSRMTPTDDADVMKQVDIITPANINDISGCNPINTHGTIYMYAKKHKDQANPYAH